MIIINQIHQLEPLPSGALSPPLKQLLTERLYQLETTGNLTRTGDQLWLAEVTDDFIEDYVAIGTQGLYSDTFDTASLGDENFVSPLEFIGHHNDAAVCELLYQMNDDNCSVIFIPDEVIHRHPELQHMLRFLEQAEIAAVGGK